MSNENDKPKILDEFVKANPEAAGAGAGASVSGGLAAAGMGDRFLACIIDGLIQVMVSFSCGMALRQPLGSLVSIVFQFIYAGYFYQERGATPGKMAMGIKVVDFETGKHLSFVRGGLRDTIGHMISSVILMAGYIMAFFTNGHRALHDFIFNTRVVRG